VAAVEVGAAPKGLPRMGAVKPMTGPPLKVSKQD
jgi:hypothetical protein